jgi:metallo-beta-lactamase family protein
METKEGKSLEITFCSGAGTVTGANFLVTAGKTKFLVDCGLVQNTSLADDVNWKPWPYDPTEIEALIITHSHIDHIGRIPKLIKDGFKGRIISTIPTKELVRPMLEDTAAILGHAKELHLNEIYNDDTIGKALSLWEGIPYHQEFQIGEVRGRLLDAGHILGSAMASLRYGTKTTVFTGDLGNSPSPLLKDTEMLTDVDYLVMESVYGDRNHENRDERKKRLEAIIEDNYKRRGTLVIPTFSLERSQELLYEIGTLVEEKRIPEMPVYFDSPLGIKLTKVFQDFSDYFNESAQKSLKIDGDLFSFPGLKVTPETDDSKTIVHMPDPKIIIAGSGMSNGGRITHHEHNYLPNPNNTLLLTGYQSMGTLGRAIEEGAKKVHIHGEEVKVAAHIEKISGYSGHKDRDHLVDFVGAVSDKVQRIFVVMGEPKSALFLTQRLRDFLGVNAEAPDAGQTVTLEC